MSWKHTFLFSAQVFFAALISSTPTCWNVGSSFGPNTFSRVDGYILRCGGRVRTQGCRWHPTAVRVLCPKAAPLTPAGSRACLLLLVALHTFDFTWRSTAHSEELTGIHEMLMHSFGSSANPR